MKKTRHRSVWEDALENADFKLTSVEFFKIIFYVKPIQLGPVEEDFLNLISQNPFSAWEISKIFKQTSKNGNGMPYGNVHRRLQRLLKLGLIEVEGKYPRNEIKYKITAEGIFTLILDFGLITHSLLKNKDDIILRTLLFQFFELETIKKFITYPREYAIRAYLRNISNAIIKKMDELRNFQMYPWVVTEVEDLILKEIEQFVFLIVVPWNISSINYRSHPTMNLLKNEKMQFSRSGYDYEENEEGDNYKDLFPKPALMKDEKFLNIVKDIKNNFDKGCKDYLLSLEYLDKF